MGGTIVAAAVARPSGRLGPLSVEAPDEDAFTLAVAAAEVLPAPRRGPVGRVDLVGDFGPEAEWAILEALDLAGVPVHRAAAGPSALFEALADRGASEPGARLVLAADSSRTGTAGAATHGAAAVVFLLQDGPGLTIRSAASHSAGPRSPRAMAWLLRAPGRAPAAGVPVWLTGADEPVRAAVKSAGPAGFVPTVVPSSLPGLGSAPTTSAALAVRALSAPPEEEPRDRTLVVLGPTTEVVVESELTGSVEWREASAGPPWPLPAGNVADGAAAADARAEGAYWPHARYLEGIRSRWRLEAERCPDDGSITFPATGACTRCGRSAGLARVHLPREGWTVEAATTVHPGAHPTEFDPLVEAAGPYDVVIARAPDGPRATFQGAGPAGRAKIGSTVDLVLRRLYPMEREWRYGRKAVVRATPDAA